MPVELTTPNAPSAGETARNALLLGTVYAVAVFFAVAFSPNMGFVTPPGHATPDGRLAMMIQGR